MRIWRKSIQWQLITSMGAALLASILVVVIIFTVALNRLTDRYLVDTALPASIEAIRNDIERMLGQPLVAAADIAGNTLLRDWLAAGEDPAQAPQFIEYLAAAKQRNKAFTTLFASTETGHYYNENGLDRTLDRSNPKDKWFYGYIDSGAERFINIDIDGATGELALFIDYRVEKQGQLVGVAGMGLRMTELSKLIHDFSFGEHGKVFLVRNDGLIQVHPDAAFSGKRQLAEQLGTDAAKGVMTGSEGLRSSRFSRDGERYLALGLPPARPQLDPGGRSARVGNLRANAPGCLADQSHRWCRSVGVATAGGGAGAWSGATNPSRHCGIGADRQRCG